MRLGMPLPLPVLSLSLYLLLVLGLHDVLHEGQGGHEDDLQVPATHDAGTSATSTDNACVRAKLHKLAGQQPRVAARARRSRPLAVPVREGMCVQIVRSRALVRMRPRQDEPVS